MCDADGGLSFDFEGSLDVAIPSAYASAAAAAAPSAPTASATEPDPSGKPAAHSGFAPAVAASDSTGFRGGGGGGRSYRQTVCRHWLRSLCMKGDACGFLHQFDKARMPICRFFRLYGECREQDCVYKHTNEDIKECNMYKLGFCPNGPDCRYRHAKMPGPPPSVEEVLQKIQQITSYGYGSSNRFFQSRNHGAPQQTEKSQISQAPSNVNQGVTSKNTPAESTNHHHQPIQQPQQPNPPGGPPNAASRGPALLPPGVSRYFIVKSCNRENLELSVEQRVWATQRSNEPKLNEAFDSAENVILIFSVNRTRHFQGCAKMTSRIGGAVSGGNWKYAHGTPHYGRNFSVKWLKIFQIKITVDYNPTTKLRYKECGLCELSFQKTRHLCNPYNENLPVKISRDCQELEPSIGEQLASLLFFEPDSDLMAVSLAAEAKGEEAKANGLNTDNGSENPDIVPFEYNEEEEEEEEEEESEEEEGGYSALPGVASFMGRGRGRGGLMWPPPMPLARGARPPMPGMRGFPPGMMGPDGYPYGDGFGMPDPFGVGPRPFPPFGPRFPRDFSGPVSGMMFPGRPVQPGSVFPGGGFGMMMGSGRSPFMGGNLGRGGRPMGMPPPPMPQNLNRMGKRDQRAPGNDRFSDGPNPGMDQESMGPGEGNSFERSNPVGAKARNEDQSGLGAGNSFRNDDSESEDEAPRRSRHGEGKKKRRGSEADGATSMN